MGTPVDIVLDSGAYSCWRRQETLTVEEYIDFIKKNEDYVHEYVNLDQIPGQFGRVPSHEQVEESAIVGWKNMEKMWASGLNPMPVFHQGESLGWLDKMIEAGCTYVGISPANDRTTSQKQEWLDEVFSHLCGSKGYPEIKTHGFGVTALPLLFRYPWYSVDSMTWILVGGYGGFFVPQATDSGDYDFSVTPQVIQVSERGAKRGRPLPPQTKHYRSLGVNSQAYINQYVQDQNIGDIEDLRDEYLLRIFMNCRFFKLAAETYTPRPFLKKKAGLFSDTRVSSHGRKKSWGNLKIIFTLTSSLEPCDVLNEEKIRDRLISYYYFKHGDEFCLKTLSETGELVKLPSKKKRKKRGKN